MSPMAQAITIPARFNGPPASANGGFACGVVAMHATEALGQTPVVTLHAPPPLNVPMHVRLDGRRAHLWAGDELVASAATTATRADVVEAVPADVAEAAQAAFAGDRHHPFPTCFVCGTKRRAGDGLSLRPGRLPDRSDTVACIWQPQRWLARPDGTIPPEIVWAVLDCPGGWTGDPATETMVLGRMIAHIEAGPRLGQRCVVVGRRVARLARTVTNLTALYTEDGRLLASATAGWVAL